MRSHASSWRMRSFHEQITERGFALVSALVIAFLYFALMQLVMIESILAYRQARAAAERTALHVLAEDGVELVARNLCTSSGTTATLESPAGKVEAKLRVLGMSERFEIEAVAIGGGSRATITLQGQMNGCSPRITSARYEP